MIFCYFIKVTSLFYFGPAVFCRFEARVCNMPKCSFPQLLQYFRGERFRVQFLGLQPRIGRHTSSPKYHSDHTFYNVNETVKLDLKSIPTKSSYLAVTLFSMCKLCYTLRHITEKPKMCSMPKTDYLVSFRAVQITTYKLNLTN